MKKNLAFILALVMLVGLFTGIVTAAREQTQVFAFSCETVEAGPYGSWGDGATTTADYVKLDAADGYGAQMFWTGKPDGNFNVVLGETYTVSVKVKGEAGKSIMMDFKDGSVGMGGSYTFAETGVWETATFTGLKSDLTYEDIPESDGNYVNGVSARVYSIGGTDGALTFYLDEVTIINEATETAVFSWDVTTPESAPFGSWADGATGLGCVTLDATDGYGAQMFWTGKTDGNFNVVLGEDYVMSFQAKGEAGKSIMFDFKDGSVGMGGSYTFQETGVWETVTSETMTANITWEDIPETDPNYGNGVSARVYSIGGESGALTFQLKDIAIYELGEEIVEPEPPEDPEVEAPEKCIWLQGNRTEDRPGNYAAIYQWTGKDADDNYNIEAGKQYIMEFDVKGTAGETIMFDFSDGMVPGAKGSYVFQSNNWEHVESPVLTMDKPYEDFAPGDGNIINGYCYRIYTIADTADTVFADRFYIDNVVIYEVDENGEKGEEAFSWDWNIDPSQYPAVLGAGGALEAMNSWGTSFGDIIVDVPEDEIVDPEDPEEPGQDPEDPEEPGEDPEDEPVEDEPVEDEPVEDEPVEDEEVEEDKKEEDKKEEAPKTADNMSVFAVVALMLASVVGVVVAKKSVLSK